MSNTKRILSIEVKRIFDESPDTSWLGEYSNNRTSDFSIDRKHSLDCASVNPANTETVDKLERAISYLQAQRQAIGNDSDNILYWSLDSSIDTLAEAQESITECDCDESGDMSRWEYRYFNPSFNYVDKNGKILPENTPEQVREYVAQDYKRMEGLQNGSWSFLGVYATAEISVNGTVQTITSGGLWGTESDSEESYLKEIESEQVSELRDTLHEMGFSKRAIATAVKEFVA